MARRYPRIRDIIINCILYIKYPKNFIYKWKFIVRGKKAKKLGVSFSPPNFIYKDHFNDKSIVIDAGCGYLADFSELMISNYQLTAYGFDPTQKHTLSLQELERKHKGKFKYIAKAITATGNKILFNESTQNESGSIINSHKNILKDNIKSYEVESITLRDIPNKVNTKKIDYIKLDIEGAEYDVLNSCSMDDLCAFQQIFVEFHHNSVKQYNMKDTKKIIKKMKDNGFDSFSFDDLNYLFFRP